MLDADAGHLEGAGEHLHEVAGDLVAVHEPVLDHAVLGPARRRRGRARSPSKWLPKSVGYVAPTATTEKRTSGCSSRQPWSDASSAALLAA